MMMNTSKDDLRTLRMRANDVFKRNFWSSVGMALLYAVVSVGLSYLMAYIQNGFLAAFSLLIQALIAASLLLGLCDYFLCLVRGEKVGVKVLIRYFDQDSLPMVGLLAGINWVAGMLGMFLGGFALALQLIVSALTFLVPYLFVVRGGHIGPRECVKEAVNLMQGRWEMYIRILARQYLYTIASSVALSFILTAVSLMLAGLGFSLLVENAAALLIVTLVLAVILSGFVMAYFQIYQAEFAVATIGNPQPEQEDTVR